MKSEVLKHLDKAEEKIKAAEVLLENRLYDDAASRAYYAMIHSIKALMVEKGLQTRSHGGLIRLFGERFVKPGMFDAEFGKKLRIAKDVREKCDYSPLYSAPAHIANNMLDDAKQLLLNVRKYFGAK